MTSVNQPESVFADSARNDSQFFRQMKRTINRSVRISAVVETIVFLSLVLVLDRFIGDGSRMITLDMHPFWIILLLVTLQYGSNEALAAAVLASCFLLVGNMPVQLISETMYDYMLRVMFLPFLWVATALIMGSIRTRQINEMVNMQERLRKSEDAAHAIAEGYNAIKQSKRKLEMRLASERCSVLTVYEVAKALGTADSYNVSDAIVNLVNVTLNPIKFSIFRWKENALRLESAHGWEKADDYTIQFDSNMLLTRTIMQKNRPFISITNEGHEEILSGQGMLAGPIIDKRTGNFYGMLKIEEIRFMDLGIRTHETFRIVCEWIASVYANLERNEEEENEAEVIPITSANSNEPGFKGFLKKDVNDNNELATAEVMHVA